MLGHINVDKFKPMSTLTAPGIAPVKVHPDYAQAIIITDTPNDSVIVHGWN